LSSLTLALLGAFQCYRQQHLQNDPRENFHAPLIRHNIANERTFPIILF
jgi:hypothetical protein